MNYGILSVIPSLLAIVLALLTKNVIIALMASLLIGNLILADYQPVNALVGLKDAMIDVFSDHSSTSIIFILLMLGGLFCLIEKSGGLSGFTMLMVEKGETDPLQEERRPLYLAGRRTYFYRRNAQRYAHRLCLPPIGETFRMSPEKNAWIVHSTATPMSILIPIAAYGPYIASFIEAQGLRTQPDKWFPIGFNFIAFWPLLGSLYSCC